MEIDRLNTENFGIGILSTSISTFLGTRTLQRTPIMQPEESTRMRQRRIDFSQKL